MYYSYFSSTFDLIHQKEEVLKMTELPMMLADGKENQKVSVKEKAHVL